MLHPARSPIFKPPRGVQINTTHPLVRGLVLSATMNQLTGSRIADGYGAWTFEGNVGWDQTGRLWFPGQNYAKCKLAINSSDANYGLNEQTILISGQIASLTNNDGDSELAMFTESPTLFCILNTGAVRLDVSTNSSYNRAISNVALSDGDKFVLCGVTSGVGNLPEPKIYLNGTDITSTSNIGSGSRNATSGLLCLGNYNDSTWANQYYGHIDVVYRWNRRLSPSEIRQISEHPYCIFEQQSRSKYFNIAAGTTYIQTASIDALIQKTGIAKTLSLDAMLQAAKAATCDLDALIALVRSGQLSLDALLQITSGSSISVDALLQAVSAGVLSIDACLQIVFSCSAVMDAILAVSLERQADLDALLQKAGFSAGIDMDALIQASILKTLSLDAILVIAGETSVSTGLDALIQAIETGDISIDALIQKAYSQSTSLDAIIFAFGLETISLDALIYQVGAGQISLDALIQISAGEQVGLDAMLYAVQDGAISIDAILTLFGSAAANLDALIYLAASRGVGLDAILGILEIVARSVITLQSRNKIITALRPVRTISAPSRIKTITVH